MNGRNLIEASAGTGKTYTIGCLFIRALLETPLSVENILVVTFTEAATSELRDRIREKTREALEAFINDKTEDPFLSNLIKTTEDAEIATRKLKIALARFDDAGIFTIHGFCKRVLTDFAFESRQRFDVEVIGDQWPFIEEITLDYWRAKLYGDDPFLPALLVNLFSTPSELSKLFIQTINKPINDILSATPTESSSHWLEIIADAFDQLKSAWNRSREEALDILVSHEAINHRSYSNRWVPAWAAQLDNYLENGNPYLLPKDLYRFSWSEVSTAKKEKAKTDIPCHDVFLICDEILESFKPILSCLKKEYVAFGMEMLKRRQAERNVQFFDDLLKSLASAINGPNGTTLIERIRERYHLALIDEFQDTDPVQYEIFKTIFGDASPNLFYIGDPKQSIYNFRGADIFAYLTAQKHSDDKYTLNQNWRSDSDLIKAVNTIFERRPNPFLFNEIDFNPTEAAEIAQDRSLLINDEYPPPLTLWYVDQEGEYASKTDARRRVTEAVAGEIVRLTDLSRQGKASWVGEEKAGQVQIDFGDMAILVRTHAEGLEIKKVLSNYRIPAVINSNVSLYKSEEFRQVITILDAIIQPNNATKLKAALVTDMIGKTGDQLEAYSHSNDAWDEIVEKYREYHQDWIDRGFLRMIHRFTRQEHICENLLRLPNGERRLTNYLHATELLQETAKAENLGMTRLLRWAETTAQSDTVSDESQIRLETDENTVRIMTIHASKGLEFPIVFCPYPWKEPDVKDVFYHDPEDEFRLKLDLGSPEIESHKKITHAELLAEDIRLLYVALTRAKHRLYMAWGKVNKTNRSALAYLLHDDPAETVDIRDDLTSLEQMSQGTIKIDPLPDSPVTASLPGVTKDAGLQVKRFSGSIKPDWNITSFTRISKNRREEDESRDRDSESDARQVETENSPIDYGNIRKMPGGTKTGNFFHEILEELDFQTNDVTAKKELIQQKMVKYRIDDAWLESISNTIDQLFALPIPINQNGKKFSLNMLSADNRINELEFYFPIERMNSQDLIIALADHIEDPKNHLFTKTLKHLRFSEIRGFMKGFVDLIFEWQGKYYIVDWKTNYLGDKLEDYANDQLPDYMTNHSYIIQYYIYALALHRLLKIRVKEYSFESHFGGVCYVFLRGISDNGSNETGLYLDSMSSMSLVIERLDSYITPIKHS